MYYQWLFDGAPLAGATNAVLRLTNAEPAQAGTYQAIVYNAAGSTTSAEARLVTVAPALITQQPLIGGHQCRQDGEVFRRGHRHRIFALPMAQGRHPSDGRHAEQPDPHQCATRQRGRYTVVITDDIGPITSAGATLVVLWQPIIVQAPLGQSVLPGARITLSVTVTNTATLPIGYR